MPELKECSANQDKIVVASGIRHLAVVDENGKPTGRYVDFNAADQGFAEELYGLASKLEKIHEDKNKEREQAEDGAARFDIGRAEDKEMREVVDSLFGEGFSKDVFHTRLFALADGLTVVENFLFALLDKMDDTITANMAKRDARIKKYTDKYSKYTSKYHK